MGKLSPHFDQSEFEHDTPIPQDCIPLLTRLCVEILEPIRAYVDEPITITSGDRTMASNNGAHGVPNSEHVYTPRQCAADFTFNTSFGKLKSVRMVFDWIRNNPTLPFRQVILEHDAKGASIIHISMNTSKDDREALEGATHNASTYSSWEVAAFYNPASGQENG